MSTTPHRPHSHDIIRSISAPPLTRGDVLEGLSVLATSSAQQVTSIVREIHREILLRPLGLYNDNGYQLWSTSASDSVYKAVFRIMQVSGNTTAMGLRATKQLLPRQIQLPLSPNLYILVSGLNGVMGDHLVAQNNPLALPMMFYNNRGIPLRSRGGLKGPVVIMIHGLCMSHYSWRIGEPDSFGEQLRRQLPELNVLYVNYNSGRHISQNGHLLATLLQKLNDENPQITHIHLLGHSMGGLVARSAMFYAKQNALSWMQIASTLFCLGSPHHGAILERLGFLLQNNVGKIPFARALARLGNIRSTGILDLRYGCIRHDDWEFLPERVGLEDDTRKPAPLPKSVKTFLIAGTIQTDVDHATAMTDALGDYLVTINSALGNHPLPQLDLDVPESQKFIFYGMNHVSLQVEPSVIDTVIRALKDMHQNNIESVEKYH